MKESIHAGMNKTGLGMAPRMSKEMLDNQDDAFKPFAQAIDDPLPQLEFWEIKKDKTEEWGAMGSVPIPTSIKGAAVTGYQKITLKKPEVLLDKLGERMAYERTGARLYEAFIAKCETVLPTESLDFLRDIHEDEVRHFHLLKDAIKDLGADPTAVTPCANAAGVMGKGLLDIVNDPRSDVAQSAQAILAAELIDNESWDLLIELVTAAGMTDTAERFQEAKNAEARHLLEVRKWLKELVVENKPVQYQ